MNAHNVNAVKSSCKYYDEVDAFPSVVQQNLTELAKLTTKSETAAMDWLRQLTTTQLRGLTEHSKLARQIWRERQSS